MANSNDANNSVLKDFQEVDLRTQLLKHVREREFSDLPIKTFKVISYINEKCEDAPSVTIRSRTRLGALIAFADHNTLTGMFITTLQELENSLCDFIGVPMDRVEKELDNFNFDGGNDIFLVEVNEEKFITLTLFPSSETKSARFNA